MGLSELSSEQGSRRPQTLPPVLPPGELLHFPAKYFLEGSPFQIEMFEEGRCVWMRAAFDDATDARSAFSRGTERGAPVVQAVHLIRPRCISTPLFSRRADFLHCRATRVSNAYD